MIKSIEYRNAAKRFRKVFSLNLNEYLDALLTNAHATALDYTKFRKAIGSRHPELDNDGVSVQDVILEHYGKEGVTLIKKLL